MNTLKLIFAAIMLSASILSLADTLSIADKSYDVPNSSASGILRPTRGMSMVKVAQQFGQANQKSPTVGQPPITKWTYPEFVVFFEYSHVIHSVVPR